MEFYSSMRGMSPEDIAKAVEKEFELALHQRKAYSKGGKDN